MTVYGSDDLIVLDLPARQEWVDYALCAQVDTDVFFPEKSGTAAPAKAICALCPVRRQCLESALARRERHGVYGGKTEFERRQILRDRKAS